MIKNNKVSENVEWVWNKFCKNFLVQIKDIMDKIMQMELEVGMKIFLVHVKVIGWARSYSAFGPDT